MLGAYFFDVIQESSSDDVILIGRMVMGALPYDVWRITSTCSSCLALGLPAAYPVGVFLLAGVLVIQKAFTN